MKITEIMTQQPECISPPASLAAAAGIMRKLGVGFLPICDHDRLTGSITDRDIGIPAPAEGRDPEATPVSAISSPKIVYSYDDQDIDEAARLMEVKQIRRLAVLNRGKRLVGIVSLGDLASSVGTQLSGEALREICENVEST